jgi:23S rRNA-/tRNA-specific pseudouridylate synthase
MTHELQLIEASPHELVVWKPPGLVSELPRDPQADSLVNRLRAQGFDDLRLVHRLDSPACGLMIVARSAEAAAHYSAEIAARRWVKLYVAEVARDVAAAQSLLGKHKAYLSTEGRRAIVVRAGGKPSFLTVLHAAGAPNAPRRSHVLVQLHTGRFHQIRVMLAAVGAPLAGDTLYGGPPGKIYLEQVVLAARPFGSPSARVWAAPAHPDRPAWAASLAAAVDAQAAAASRLGETQELSEA